MDLLDLFSGTFGAGYGYLRAGFNVTGIDLVERRDIPEGVTLIKADVRDVLTDLDYLRTFDAIHASPPCKVHSGLVHLMRAQGGNPIHGDLVPETRDALDAAGVPYIIENVERSPLRPDVILCGSMFGLGLTDDTGPRYLQRHRKFELGGWGNYGIGLQLDCKHVGRPLGVYGSKADDIPEGGQTARTLEEARILMGIPWASWAGITQAIPPAYTEYLGRALLEHLESVTA